mmetsp:Transcript_35652/g.83423  ORF Transcript_35652/g.83423 Transcript_35652/m.83423 type:complete len:500 (-) Transcript_35652:163-1662(-)
MAEKGDANEVSKGLPAEMRRPFLFYIATYFGQRLAFAAINSLSVFMWDHGFREGDIATFTFITRLPYTIKVFVSILNDMMPPPWEGNLCCMSGRRRPVAFWFTLVSLAGVLLFAVLNGKTPGEDEPPTLGNLTLAGFIIVLGVAFADVATDAHAVELVAPVSPDYVTSFSSLTAWTGRTNAVQACAQVCGYLAGAFLITQLGSQWSYFGAFMVIAAIMGPLSLAVIIVPDTKNPPPGIVGRVTCGTVCKSLLAREPRVAEVRFLRKAYFVGFLAWSYAGGVEALTVPFLKREYDISVQDEGYVRSAMLVGSMIGAAFGGALVDRFGPIRILKASIAASIPASPAVWLASKYGGAGWGAVSCGLGGAVFGPASAATAVLYYRYGDPACPAFSFTFAMFTNNVGISIGGLVLVLADMGLDYGYAFGFISAVQVLTLVCVIWSLATDPVMVAGGKLGECEPTSPSSPTSEKPYVLGAADPMGGDLAKEKQEMVKVNSGSRVA